VVHGTRNDPRAPSPDKKRRALQNACEVRALRGGGRGAVPSRSSPVQAQVGRPEGAQRSLPRLKGMDLILTVGRGEATMGEKVDPRRAQVAQVGKGAENYVLRSR